MKDLTNKVAYITGGTKGIGLGIAQALLAQGMKVAITGRDADTTQQIATQLHPENCLGIGSDVTSLTAEQNAVAKTIEKFGQIDVTIANAGICYFASIFDLTDEQWHKMIDTNLTGVFHTTKATIPALIETKGYLITIASLAGTNFFAKGSGYNATKFGVVGFTQAAMLDLRDYDIKTTVIMPGSVATHFNGHAPTEADAWKIQPEDIGEMVVNLLKMNERSLPSKIEMRPSFPHKK